MDGGRDDMRGAFAAQLDDVLAEVGLDHLKAGLLEGRVECKFFRGHRLALDNAFGAAFAGDFQDIVARLGGVRGDENLASVGLEPLLELNQEFVKAVDSVLLDAARGVALVVEMGKFAADLVDVFEVAASRAFELAAQFGVGDAATARLKKIRLRRCASHLSRLIFVRPFNETRAVFDITRLLSRDLCLTAVASFGGKGFFTPAASVQNDGKRRRSVSVILNAAKNLFPPMTVQLRKALLSGGIRAQPSALQETYARS